MSMSYSLIAFHGVERSFDRRFIDAAKDTAWIAQSPDFDDHDSLLRWATPRSYSLGWSPEKDKRRSAIGFYTDGAWLVALDYSMTMIAWPDQIAAASTGRIVSATTHGSSGVAIFQAFTGGKLIREISSADGEMETKGDRLPEEPPSYESFYLDEIDALWTRHGLTSFINALGDAPGPYWGHALYDLTDYAGRVPGDIDQARGAESAPKRPAPWWNFWRRGG
jgi:hypothetical protein